MAAAVIFSAVSCAKEDISSSIGGGEVEVTFTANLADMGTRAIGDGTKADVVYLAIYEAGTNNPLSKEIIDPTKPIDVVDKKASISVVLLKDKKYDLVFWAQNSDVNCYKRDLANRTMTIDYKNAKSQVEKSDAFFLVCNDWKAGEVKNPEFTLKRPFAQLNVGLSADEVKRVQNNGVVVENIYSAVTVEGLANVLDLGSANPGAVSAKDFDGVVTYRSAAKPTEALSVSGIDYNYLSMNYLLVNGKQNVDVTYTFEEKDAEGTQYIRPYYNVPVQRNFRTNIVGNILSSEYEFNVIIVPEFEEPANNYVTTIEDLQLILDNAKADENNEVNEVVKIILGADMKGDVTVLQKEGLDFIIDGNEKKYKFDGTITINGDARSKGTETLTITNVNFVTESKKDFISAPTKVNSKYNYSHNVTVDNCTFSSPAYNEEIVGIKLLTTYNAVVKNCTATNIHTLAQFQSTDNATVIENVKVVNCKNGISLGNMASATITNAEISANGYGVRLDGAKEREVAVTIENATINAYIPVNVRKMNDDACKATVKFEGENNLTGATYEIAFCSNEYEDGVAPAAPKGTFTLDGAEGFDAYVGPIVSASAFDAAINSNGDVVVEEKIESVGTGFEIERDVVLDFNNKELNAGSTASSTWYALEIYGENDVEINNANFTRAGVYANGANVVFNSGVINHNPDRTSRYIFCARSGATITVKDGTFKNDRAKNSFFWADNSTIYVKGGNFGGVASNNKVVTSNGGQVIITGGTFNFDPTAWVPTEGYKVTKNGSTWTVSFDGAVVGNDTDLNNAIDNDNSNVYLSGGDYTLPSISGKDVAIYGDKDVVLTINKPNLGGSTLTLNGITVQGKGYATGIQHVNTVTYNNVTVVGEMCLYGEQVVFEGCDFELNNGQYIWVYGAKKAEFNNCTFNTTGKAILIYNEGAGANDVTVAGCTFNASAGAKAGAIANQNCAAIELDNFQSSGVGAAHKLVASNNTYSDNFSGEWRIKNFVAGNAITVNDVEYNQIALDGKLMTIDSSKNVTVLE